MKIFEVLAYLAFFIGLFEKVFHTQLVPFPAVIMIFGVLLVLVLNIVRLRGPKKHQAIIGLSLFLWMVYLLLVLKYFVPYQAPILTAAILMSLYTAFRVIKERLRSYNLILWFLFMISGVSLAFVPLADRYYIINIKFNSTLYEDPFFWDRYSWWLNIDGRHDEAIEASSTALMIINKWEEGPEKLEWTTMVEDHRNKLETKSWTIFHDHH